MKFVADFHLHSKYSRATSPRMDLENLDKWGRIKGIKILGTGDFTHPVWLKELKEKLEPAESGLFKIKNNNKETKFILSAEISCIYSKKGRVRKIHTVILAPSFDIVEKINNRLDFIGNLKADGRPILGLDAKELVKIVLDASEKCLVIPAHVMTPWFSLFGSKSGFDSIEECFEEYTKYIYALETGLSADPSMLWRTAEGQKLTLISNSDAHCVHPTTEIYTIDKKPKAIKDLNPSEVLSIDLAGDLRQRRAKISKLHKLSSPSALYRISTQVKKIITTPEHSFFVLGNEEIINKKAFELKKGDLVACLRRISNKGKSRKLPYFSIDHKVKILPEGVDQLKALRIAHKKSQKDIGEYIGVSEGCIFIFEKNKIKTPKESFINKYCECLRVNKDDFKKEFMVYRFPSEKFPEFTGQKFCQLLGYILGDGGIERSRGKITSLSLTDKNLVLLKCYQDLIKNLFNVNGKFKKKRGNSYTIRYPAFLARYFQKIDTKILISSPKREMPEFIFSLSKEEIAAFLKGLFDAEGTVAHHSIEFCSSCLVLTKEVQALLLKFGINSSIYSDFEKNKKKWRYRLSIYGQEQLKNFKDEIGFNSIPKKRKLSQYLSSCCQNPKNSFTDFLPFKKTILNVKEALKVSCYDIPGRLYYHLNHMSYSNTLKRNNVKEFVEIFSNYPYAISILEKIKKFVDSDIIWEFIKDVKKIKSDCEFVYDLTVPVYENYVANGFITHNSPEKIGREANIFDTEISYPAIFEAIKSKDRQKFLSTIEFFPQEGKYHFDGHRNCNVRLSPSETKKYNNICPNCGKGLTVGVLNRIEQIAVKPEGFKPENTIPFKNLVPLKEIVAEALGMTVASKKVEREYNSLLEKLGSELKILLDISFGKIEEVAGSEIAEGITRVREGKVFIEPGYDGVYGTVKIFSQQEPKALSKQKTLF